MTDLVRSRRKRRRQKRAQQTLERERQEMRSTSTMLIACAALFITLARVVSLRLWSRAPDSALDFFLVGAGLMLAGMMCWWLTSVVATRLQRIGITLMGVVVCAGLLGYMTVYPTLVAPMAEASASHPLNAHQIALPRVERSHLYQDDELDIDELAIAVEHDAIRIEDHLMRDEVEFAERFAEHTARWQRQSALLHQPPKLTALLAVDRCMDAARLQPMLDETARHHVWQMKLLVYSPLALDGLYLPGLAPAETPRDEGVVFRLSPGALELVIDEERVARFDACEGESCEVRALEGDETCAPSWRQDDVSARVRQALMSRFDDEARSYLLLVRPDVPVQHLVSFLDATSQVCAEPGPSGAPPCESLLRGALRFEAGESSD